MRGVEKLEKKKSHLSLWKQVNNTAEKLPVLSLFEIINLPVVTISSHSTAQEQTEGFEIVLDHNTERGHGLRIPAKKWM